MEEKETALTVQAEREENRQRMLRDLDAVTHKGWTKAFLSAFAKSGIVGVAAKDAQITPRAVQLLANRNDTFRNLMRIAKEEAVDSLEAAALHRAKFGTKRFVMHKGQAVKDPRDTTGKTLLTETKQSDAVLIFLLKKLRYPDKVEHQHTGAGGGPIVVEHGLRDEEVVGRVKRVFETGHVIDIEAGAPQEFDDDKLADGETDSDADEVNELAAGDDE